MSCDDRSTLREKPFHFRARAHQYSKLFRPTLLQRLEQAFNSTFRFWTVCQNQLDSQVIANLLELCRLWLALATCLIDVGGEDRVPVAVYRHWNPVMN